MNQATCLARMKKGACGRPIYALGKCICHLDGADKECDKFEVELAKILEDDKLPDFDLTGFVFPEDYERFPGPISKSINFEGAIFYGKINFTGVIFECAANFTRANFKQKSRFTGTEFKGGVVFALAEFTDDADFDESTFNVKAVFGQTVFKNWATFQKATFNGPGYFAGAIFDGVADFRHAKFLAGLTMRASEFHEYALFNIAEFKTEKESQVDKPKINFEAVKFIGPTEFGFVEDSVWRQFHTDEDTDEPIESGAIFHGPVSFANATFEQRASFNRTSFHGTAKFDECRFNSNASFDNATFHDNACFIKMVIQGELQCCETCFGRTTKFTETRFKGPVRFKKSVFGDGGKIIFENIDASEIVEFLDVKFLGKSAFLRAHFRDRLTFNGGCFNDSVLFHNNIFGKPELLSFQNLDLSKISFRGTDVSRTRFYLVSWNRGPKRSGTKRLRNPFKSNRRRIINEIVCNNPRRYEEVAEIYRALQISFINYFNYKDAGDFDIGEREMIRKSKGWAHQILSLDPYYKIISNYGQSVRLPFSWLALVLLIAPWLFMGANDGFSTDIRDLVFINGEYWRMAAMNIAVMARTASLPQEFGYFLRAIVALETITVVSLITFFLLALRRRFRRKSF